MVRGVCPTLTGDHENRITDYSALCVYPEITGALCANSHPGSYTGQDAYNDMLPVINTDAVLYPGVGITSKENASNPQPGDPACTLSTDSRNYLVHSVKPPRRYIVRRLTPLECCRLQGFPDWWEENLATPEPTKEDIDFWADVFETHRKATAPDIKPKTRNQIAKWLKQPYSDSASYKMWGNGMAYPCMSHVMQGIVRVFYDT